MYERLSPTIEQAVQQADAFARRLGHDYIGTEHLLMGLLLQTSDPPVGDLLRRGLTIDTVRERLLREWPAAASSVVGPLPQSPRLAAAMTAAIEAARHEGTRLVMASHMLSAIQQDATSIAAQLLNALAGSAGNDTRQASNSVGRLRRKSKPSVIPAQPPPQSRAASAKRKPAGRSAGKAARKSRTAAPAARKPGAAKRRPKPTKSARRSANRRRP